MDSAVDARLSARAPHGAHALAPAFQSRDRIPGRAADDASPRVFARRAAVTPGQRWHTRFGGLMLAIAINVIALALFVRNEPMRHALSSAVPLRVSLLTLPIEDPTPLPVKVIPKLAPRPVETIAPLPVVAPEPPPPAFVPPAIPMQQVPPPAIATAIATTVEAPPPLSLPAPLVAPRFDADYLQNPAPAYPPLSRRLGEQGKVMLRVLVNPAGLPEKIELRASSGSDRLDQAALDTVARWRFVAARQGDVATSGWVLIPITFSLKS